MFYRTHKKDQLQNQQRRYDALCLQLSIIREVFISQNLENPDNVYLQKDDLDFVRTYHGILNVIGNLPEKSVDEIFGMEIMCGDKMLVEKSQVKTLNFKL